MLSWTALPSVISTVAWIPWIIATVYGVFGTRDAGLRERDEERWAGDEGSKTRRGTRDAGFGEQDEGRGTGDEGADGSGVRRPEPGGRGRRARGAARHLVGLAVSVAMMLLAGHLQFAAYGLMAAGLVAVWLFVATLTRRDRGTRGVGRAERDEGPGTKDEGAESSHQVGHVRRACVGLGLTILGIVLGAML